MAIEISCSDAVSLTPFLISLLRLGQDEHLGKILHTEKHISLRGDLFSRHH